MKGQVIGLVYRIEVKEFHTSGEITTTLRTKGRDGPEQASRRSQQVTC